MHQRPSALVGWNTEEDWLDRYLFDMMIMSEFIEARNKEYERHG